jgi:hypothetical protein
LILVVSCKVVEQQRRLLPSVPDTQFPSKLYQSLNLLCFFFKRRHLRNASSFKKCRLQLLPALNLSAMIFVGSSLLLHLPVFHHHDYLLLTQLSLKEEDLRYGSAYKQLEN